MYTYTYIYIVYSSIVPFFRINFFLRSLTGISSLAVLIVGPGASNADNNLHAAEGENLGISNCFFGSVGRSFNEISSGPLFI